MYSFILLSKNTKIYVKHIENYVTIFNEFLAELPQCFL